MSLFATYPSLVDRPVLITGGASGIGATLVSEFAGQGARVAFIDIDEASANHVLERTAACRHAPAFVKADLTNLRQLADAVHGLSKKVGPFRALLNNAANDERRAFVDVTPEDWDRGIAVNLRHQFFAAQYVAPAMASSGGGSIVNFGSISWMLRQAQLSVYATSKAAIHGLSRSLARELGPSKIRVNTLLPGWTMTEKQLRERVTEQSRDDIAKGQCLSGMLLAGHIARCALFLASDDSEMCTGQEFIVDGGWA